MMGRGSKRDGSDADTEIKGFDAFDLRLGDLMRGERATLGKSLLDVQRELRIKAAYIAAIENADPSAFDTPGFIAGYVRSYARYLGMDPEQAFETFCAESGFTTAHGMSSAASTIKSTRGVTPVSATGPADMFASPAMPYLPASDRMLSRIEPGAIGSVLVLLAIIGGLGYGGWTVLQEVQRVQLAPVEQPPTVIAEIDPLAGQPEIADDVTAAAFGAPTSDALDRLYRPEALDVPRLVPRDGPISTIDPRMTGTFVPPETRPEPVTAAAAPDLIGPSPAPAPTAVAEMQGPPVAQVTEDPIPGVRIVAVRDVWVRVNGADGSVLHEAMMRAGDEYSVPLTENPPLLRTGNAGATYFMVNGEAVGPVGSPGDVVSEISLAATALQAEYQVADLEADPDLAEYLVAERQSAEAASE